MSAPSTPPTSSLDDLYARPGVLLRRAHQIAVAVFLDETGELDVTTTQYGALYVLQHVADLDQIGLARVLGIDRSTSALVLSKLEASGWVRRETDPADRRRKLLKLTVEGLALLDAMGPHARRVRERLLSAFTADEQRLFLALMVKFVAAFNSESRTPVSPPQP